MIASGLSPTSRTAIPSAIVAPPTETVSPASRCAIAEYAATSTPYTVMPGFIALAATAQPASSPPPPTGITSASRSGASCNSSSARVPWPAITPRSS
jgi:hypothetical protein